MPKPQFTMEKDMVKERVCCRILGRIGLRRRRGCHIEDSILLWRRLLAEFEVHMFGRLDMLGLAASMRLEWVGR